MRTVYYLTLSVQRGQEPAVLLDIEFPDMPTLNAMLAEVHEADLSAYILCTSGERDVKFSHRMLGDSLAAEFRTAAGCAKPEDTIKLVQFGITEDEAAASIQELRDNLTKTLGVPERIIYPERHRAHQERERRVERHLTGVTVAIVTAGVLGFIGACLYLWSRK